MKPQDRCAKRAIWRISSFSLLVLVFRRSELKLSVEREDLHLKPVIKLVYCLFQLHVERFFFVTCGTVAGKSGITEL